MIGIYGGSFDPVHVGHVQVARFLLDAAGLSRLIFVPAYSHAFDKSLTPYHHREHMLRLATMDMPDIGISDIEKLKGGTSYTIDLLRLLDQLYGTGQYRFITGMDNLNTFLKWKDWDTILRNWNLVFTTRAGIEPDRTVLNKMAQVAGGGLKQVDRLDVDHDGSVLITVPDWPLSASMMRKLLLNGERPSDMMDSKVLDYINDQQLYRLER